jgi:hypothetical protein
MHRPRVCGVAVKILLTSVAAVALMCGADGATAEAATDYYYLEDCDDKTMPASAGSPTTTVVPIVTNVSAPEPIFSTTTAANTSTGKTMTTIVINETSTATTPPTKVNELPKSQTLPPTEPSSTPRSASWRDHPAYRASPSMTLPILAWYTTRSNELHPWAIYGTGLHTRQGARLTLIGDDVKGTPEARKYHNFDLLMLGTYGAKVDNFLDFETTRDSKICLVMGIDDNRMTGGPNAVMKVPAGWESIGMAQWEEGEPMPTNHKYSQYQGEPVQWAYLACKIFPAGLHKLASPDRLGAQYKVWGYNLLIGEVDGSVPPLSPLPKDWSGPAIVEHDLCPDSLHDMWVLGSHDDSDPEIKGKVWKTWHPSHDFIYGCYMGHEHGSPGSLVGYTERFHYTAFKNDNQDESHEGFKGYAFKIPNTDQHMYVNLHAETKDISRVNVEFHTMVIAVTSKAGDLEYEMSCKTSFGGAGADFKSQPETGVPFLPMGNAASQKRLADMYDPEISYYDRKISRKRINLLNKDNPDTRLRYEMVNNRNHGVYEGWLGAGGDAFCMNATEAYQTNGIDFDIKDAHTGCHDQACTSKVVLGSDPDEYRTIFRPNLGSNREIVFFGIVIGPNQCKFDLPTRISSGIFYTDQYCKEVFDGPGKNRVRQIMKPTFTGVNLNDAFAISDVHGHSYYEISRPGGPDDFENEKEGLEGFNQYEASLGINVSDK